MNELNEANAMEDDASWLYWFFELPSDRTYYDTEASLQKLQDTYQNEYRIELEAEILSQSSCKSQWCIMLRLNKEDGDLTLHLDEMAAITGFDFIKH
jgi:hypothetical protein